MTLRYTTVTANAAGTGANVASSSSTTIGATAIAEPAGGGENCSPFPGFGTTRVSEGYSWFSDTSCEAGPADVVEDGGDAQLGPLGDNGGPTPTRPPAATSPLGGMVPGGACDVATDQRGELRPAGEGCEAGSVEVEEVPAAAPIVGTPWPDILVGTAGDDEIRGPLCEDRDNPGRYLNIVEFDSYEEAMENSNDPTTQEFAGRMMALADGPPTFTNLDVIEEHD